MPIVLKSEKTMEAVLQTINNFLLSVIGQPKGNLVTLQTPITQVIFLIQPNLTLEKPFKIFLYAGLQDF